MKRRSFLSGLLLAASAPAAVRASSLIPKKEIVPDATAHTPVSFSKAIEYRGCATREQIMQLKPEAGHMYTVTNDHRVMSMLSDGKGWFEMFSVPD